MNYLSTYRGLVPAIVVFLSASMVMLASTPLRLSILEGDAAVLHSGSDTWVPLERNFPIAEGDRLVLQPGSRLELEIGIRAAIRLDADADLAVESVYPAEFKLFHGSAIVRTGSQEVRITTPSEQLLFRPRGYYRLNVNETNDEVIVFQGSAALPEGEEIPSGRQVSLSNGKVVSEQYRTATTADLFQLWSDRRDSFNAFDKSAQYLPGSVPGGAADLDRYGNWQNDASYGHVWYPIVGAGWCPYRVGHWYWAPRFGWTWISWEPWGWLPYHFGRWRFGVNGWCWIPGGPSFFTTWSPALVHFLRSNSFVGWFPLGPGDVFHPGRGLVFNQPGGTFRGGNWGAPGGLVVQPVDRFARGEPVAQSVSAALWNLGDARITPNVSDIRPVRPSAGNWMGGAVRPNSGNWMSDRREGRPVAVPGNSLNPPAASGIPAVTGGAIFIASGSNTRIVNPQEGKPRVVVPQEFGSRVVIPQDGGSRIVNPQEGKPRIVVPQEFGSRVVIPQDGGPRLVNPQDGGSRVVNPQDGGSRMVIPRRGPPSGMDRPISAPRSAPSRESAPIHSRPMWAPRGDSGSHGGTSHTREHGGGGSSSGHSRRH